MAIPKDILCNQTAAGLRLAHQVFSKTDNNAVLSPLSIHIALSMVAAGAAGRVKEEIVSFLGANSDEQLRNFASKVVDFVFSDSSESRVITSSDEDDDRPRLSAANAVWLKDSLTFKSSFKQTMETDYKAATKQIDFTKLDEVVREVNAWAEEMTNGRIKNLVTPDSFNIFTVLVGANALYFKGTWADMFDPDDTTDDAFFRTDGTPVDVPFMTSGVDRAIGTYDTFKVLNLPYCRGERDKRSFSMSIFLPNDRDGLLSLLKKVCTEGSSFLNRHIPKTIVDVGELRVPKFRIEVDFNVLDVLKELGLEIGHLTEMVEEDMELPVILSNVVHKAFVEVNEAGTEAAAVTEYDGDLGCSLYDTPPVVVVDFIADHPFMFVIREDSSGLVLFVGQVLDPSS